MTDPQQIKPLDAIEVYDRRQKKVFVEEVYGDFFVRLLYGNKIGQFLTETFLVKKPLSRLMGIYYNSRFSSRLISPFVKKFKIAMDEFQVPPNGFRNFNEFFIREFEPGIRRFSIKRDEVCAPCEARYLIYDKFSIDQTFTLKGAHLNIRKLLNNHSCADEFDGGTCFIARLCPVDYHRFHFHDSGKIRTHFRIKGKLHSVNPLALKYDPEVFQFNEREVTIFDSQNTGAVLYIEVGAMGVGSIKQKNLPGETVSRGDQKGWFEFGGSSVIIIFQKDRIKIDTDILEQSTGGNESFIRLGETIAKV